MYVVEHSRHYRKYTSICILDQQTNDTSDKLHFVAQKDTLFLN